NSFFEFSCCFFPFFYLFSFIPCLPLFPYTTLFRSWLCRAAIIQTVCDSSMTVNSKRNPSTPSLRTSYGRYLSSSAKVHRRGHISDRKSTRLNSIHVKNSYAVSCLKKKKQIQFRLIL